MARSITVKVSLELEVPFNYSSDAYRSPTTRERERREAIEVQISQLLAPWEGLDATVSNVTWEVPIMP